MKRVIVKFNMKIDLSESVEEMIQDGEFDLGDSDIVDFALDCLLEDLRDLAVSELKSKTTIEISEE